MTDTKHPEALRLAALYDADAWPGGLSLNAWAAASAAELRRLHTENTTLQQGYDAARLEIDHLRGATKMVEPAQPVAWLVYLPSIDTQNVYDSQDDPGYVDDVTNHADAEVTPLYEMAAPKAEVAPSGEYPPLPTPDSYLFQHEETGVTQYVDSQQVEWGFENNNPRLQRIGGAFTEAQMRAYVDADRAMRAQAAPAAVASPLTKLQRKAIAVCFTSDKVSVSEVQRKLSISYADAQTLCQSIVDLGLTDELELAPSLKRGAPAPHPAPVAQGDARVQGLIAAADYIDGPASGYAAEHSYTEPSPMAKVAAALRQKAEQEDAAYQARRSDQGLMESEWGPMEDAPPHEDPPMHVAVVEGDDAVRTLQWNRDVAAFAYPVGTLLYAEQSRRLLDAKYNLDA